ncbi:MAG: hypothetical protein ACRD0A_14275 [Acidimicrobiales bacterium]
MSKRDRRRHSSEEEMVAFARHRGVDAYVLDDDELPALDTSEGDGAE